MFNEDIIDLSKYRFQSAKEDLETAQLLMKDGRFKASVNRSYYAIFHGLRSVTALSVELISETFWSNCLF